MQTTTTTIPMFGQYTYTDELFESAMTRTVAQLWEIYKAEFGEDPRRDLGNPTEHALYRKLRKAQLAAIIAWRWTSLLESQIAEDHREALILNAERDSVGSFSGDLDSLIQEARGHVADCGRTYGRVSHVLSYIEHTFDGGMFAFAVATKPLW